MVCGPDGNIIYEAGEVPTFLNIVLDVDKVKDARLHGTFFCDQYIRQLALFNPPQPYAGRYHEAPVVKSLPKFDLTYEELWENQKKAGIGTIGKR